MGTAAHRGGDEMGARGTGEGDGRRRLELGSALQRCSRGKKGGGGRSKKGKGEKEKRKKEKKRERESCRRDSRRRSATRALRGFGRKRRARKTGKTNREMGCGLVRVSERRIVGKDFGTSGVWTEKDLE